MSTEIARTQDSLQEIVGWSQNMSMGDLLPTQYRGKPANLMFAAEYADALGVSRIHVMTSIAVINGRPSPSADLMGAMVRNKGHKLRITGDDTYAEAILIRADDPDYEFVARWDIAKARTAGLWGNRGPWTLYPAAMLRARAISEVVRMGASDVMAGSIYTPEELGADVDADGNPLPQQMQATRQDAPAAPQPQQNQSDRLMAHIDDSQTQNATQHPAGTSSDDGLRGDFEAAKTTGDMDLALAIMNQAAAAGHNELAQEINTWGMEMQELAQQQQNTTPSQGAQPEGVKADDIASAVANALDGEVVN